MLVKATLSFYNEDYFENFEKENSNSIKMKLSKTKFDELSLGLRSDNDEIKLRCLCAALGNITILKKGKQDKI